MMILTYIHLCHSHSKHVEHRSTYINQHKDIFVHDGSSCWNCFQFSASPGRFFLTDIQSSPDGQLVEIKAEFPWGSEIVETVHYSGTKLFENIESTEREIFEVCRLYLSKRVH